MKLFVILAFSLAIVSACGLPGGWQTASTTLDNKISETLKFCLKTISQKENILSLAQGKITDLYLHFTQVVNGINHKITFRTEYADDVKLIQVIYNENVFGGQPGESISLMSYSILDNTAKFSNNLAAIDEESMEEAILRLMKILKPDVISNLGGSFLAVNSAQQVHGRNFYNVKAMLQGTDNSISQYEFWFETESSVESVCADGLNIFAYVKLRITRESQEQSGNLAEISDSNGEVQCSSISSYYLCSAYPQCSSEDYVNTSVCKAKETVIEG